MLLVQVEGSAAAVLAGGLIAPAMVAFQEGLTITEAAQNLAHVGSGTGLAPTLGDIGVPGFKSLAQGVANLGDQEVESHVADAFQIF